MESWHFNTFNDFEFGARSRNYGYLPRNRTEIEEWYELFIDYTVSLSLSEVSYSSKAKAKLADKFRALWVQAKMHNQLEAASISIAKTGEWKEGWVAVKSTIKFDGAEMEPQVLQQINRNEKILKPMTLIERARVYAFSNHRMTFDLIDTVEMDNSEDEFTKVEQYTRFLGSKVAADGKVFQQLLPELLSNDNPGIIVFGEGLAQGSDNLEQLWQNMLSQLS